MVPHLRANLWLLVLTIAVCSVLYPLLLWIVGQTVLTDQAEGSLIRDSKGKPVGSRLIGQAFTGDEYFQPRPSAVAYNAAASGASNWGANNPQLRDRVGRTLGLVARYKTAKGEIPAKKTVQEDVIGWFQSRPTVVAEWTDRFRSSARAWVNGDDKHKAAVTAWMSKHPEVVTAWQKDNAGQDPTPADLAGPFFKTNAAAFQRDWPKLTDDSAWSVPAVFFDLWLQAHPQALAGLEPVPADMVLASGSGLDPHITLQNARYQLDRVATAWAAKLERDKNKVKGEIEDLLKEHTTAPLGGLVGVELVNVLEINLTLRDAMLTVVRR
jgi:K+-transporting ATPase ATPase C chain